MAVGSAGLHAVVAATGGWTAKALLVALGMALACTACAVHLVARPHSLAWAQAALFSAVMFAAHPVLMSTDGHAHHGSVGPVEDALAWGMLIAPAAALALASYGFLISRSAAPAG